MSFNNPTVSQKAHEKVHFRWKITPPNPDLATGLCIHSSINCCHFVAQFTPLQHLFYVFSGVIGIVTSSQAEHLVETLRTTNVPLVSPLATAPSLTEDNSLFFRTIPSDILQMKVFRASFVLIKTLELERKMLLWLAAIVLLKNIKGTLPQKSA